MNLAQVEFVLFSAFLNIIIMGPAVAIGVWAGLRLHGITARRFRTMHDKVREWE